MFKKKHSICGELTDFEKIGFATKQTNIRVITELKLLNFQIVGEKFVEN